MKLRYVICALLWACLSACGSLGIGPPGANLTYGTPVPAMINATADIEPGSVRATLDGVDVTNAFVFGAGLRELSASLPAAPGPHTLAVSARLWNSLYRTYDPKTAQVSFNAAPGGSFALTMSPNPLAIAPGATEQLGLTVARAGAFQGEVRVAIIGASVVIPATGNAGSLPISAAADSFAGVTTETVWASGPLYDGSVGGPQTVTKRYAHVPGRFKRGLIAANGANQTVTGPDGYTALTVQNGPPMAPRFEARYRRPTGQLGQEIGFDPGTPAFGGAGFCPNRGGAFVISGGSASANHALIFMMTEDPLPRIAFPLPATASASTPVVEPVLYFSPGCGLVVAVGADPTTQQAFRAHAFDIHQRKLLCSVAFNTPSTMVVAELLAPASGNQQLTITAGGQSSSCPVF